MDEEEEIKNMSLTRKSLSAMGIEGEKMEQILDMHLETVNGLKDQISTYKTDALKVPEISKKLEELEKAQQNPDEYKAKYEQESKAFEDFKKQIETEKVNSTKKSAYTKLLEENKIKQSKWDLIMRTVKLDDLKLKDDTTLENSEDLNKGIVTDWADFVEHEVVKGVAVARPPISGDEKTIKNEEQIRKFTNSLGIPELLENKK